MSVHSGVVDDSGRMYSTLVLKKETPHILYQAALVYAFVCLGGESLVSKPTAASSFARPGRASY